MLEFMYKLNLPPLDEILTENGKKELFVGKNTTIYKQYDPKDLLKSEWLKWRNIEWDFVNFFYKPNHRGFIHIDGPGVWGINWIHNGFGLMEYWQPEDVTILEPEPDEINSIRSECFTNKKPYKIYNVSPGAYLTNAILPHRATGIMGRYALSLRCYKSDTWVPWDQAIIKFKDLFI